jgi:phage/plasmid-like protein (TIGR03299 family)
MTNVDETTTEAPAGAFSVRTVPWMKLGTVIDAPVPVAEAAQRSGLDFEVDRRPIQFHDGKQWHKFPGRVALVRADDRTPLSIVSDTYETLQYREAFDFIDAVEPHIVAAGPLRGGRQAFMVAHFQDHRVDLLGDDGHELYLVLRTSHDLTRATEASIMPLRGRCMNQLGLNAFAVGARMRWSVPHVKGARAKLIEAQKAILNLKAATAGLANFADRMAKIDLELDAARELVTSVLPDRPRREDTVDTIINLWENSPTVGYTGTGWGLLNAVSEYFDHARTGGNVTDVSRFTGALQGAGHRALNRTAALLLRRA